jgi:hypothetical protein
MVYSWRATGQVMAELHSEPDGAPIGYAETFDKQQGTQGAGAYTAPFSGIHGLVLGKRGPERCHDYGRHGGLLQRRRRRLLQECDLPHRLTDLQGRKLPAAPATRARP